jgi:hypothetical protein
MSGRAPCRPPYRPLALPLLIRTSRFHGGLYLQPLKDSLLPPIFASPELGQGHWTREACELGLLFRHFGSAGPVRAGLFGLTRLAVRAVLFPGDNFIFSDRAWSPLPHPGYAVPSDHRPAEKCRERVTDQSRGRAARGRPNFPNGIYEYQTQLTDCRILQAETGAMPVSEYPGAASFQYRGAKFGHVGIGNKPSRLVPTLASHTSIYRDRLAVFIAWTNGGIGQVSTDMSTGCV